MLTHYCGTDLFDLADQLRNDLADNPPDNILTPEIFVVQNHGMAHWLSVYIAEIEGIVANMDFEFPAERIWSLIRLLNPEIPRQLPSDLQPMTWTLMKVLSEGEKEKIFTLLYEYIEVESPEMSEMRRWKLARRIADVYDQYLTYRPEMIQSWEKRKPVTGDQSEQWQMQLWNRLREYWQTHAEEKWKHQSTLYQKLLTDIDSGKYSSNDLPNRISVFGVNSMPPVFLKTLVKLSTLTDVNIYQLAPGIAEPTPLQESLGRKCTDFRKLLDTMIGEEQMPGSEFERIHNESESESESLLQHLKKSIAGLEYFSETETDDSIRIHSCHSAMREVEVLYDQLLALMDENPDINPSDVLILTPDIETYAPLVEAVFGTPEPGLPEIPFHITEKTHSDSQQVIQVFNSLLNLVQSRFKATEVFEFISLEPVRARFKLSDEDLSTLERWIDETGVKWGIDGTFKKRLGLPGTDYVTWKSGLQQILMGYVMRQNEDRLFSGILPYEEIEGTQRGRLAGVVAEVLNTLFNCYEQGLKSRTPAQWTDLMLKWIDSFINDVEEYAGAKSVLRDAVQKLAEMQGRWELDNKISFAVTADFLKDEIKQQTYSRYSGQGVTFSSIVAMHNIPSRVTGIIGLNEDNFPRNKIPAGFDLIARNPRPGDRIPRLEDRQFLFEIMLSVREKLYFSYVGQSNKQDARFPPSVVLRELIDYLETTFHLRSKDLITEHPLQAFSKNYFSNEKEKLFSYSQKRFSAAQILCKTGQMESAPFMSGELPLAEDDFKTLSVGDLVTFYQHPAKFLLQNRLGIFLKEEHTLDEDRELFELDNLTEYRLAQKLLDRYLNGQDLKEYESVAGSKNMLPEGLPGHQQFEEKAKEVELFGNYLNELLQQSEPQRVDVDITCGSFNISGRLLSVYPRKQLLYRFGKARSKDLVRLWIHHLVLQSVRPAEHSGKTVLVARDKSIEVYELNRLADGDATKYLGQLLDHYWKGLQKPFPFFPECSYVFAEQVLAKDKSVQYGIDRARRKWTNKWSYTNEGEDPYNIRMFNHANPIGNNDFQRLAKLFWKPFFEYIKKIKVKQ